MFEQILAWYNGLTDSLFGSLILFIGGALLLIKGGDWFVDSSVGIAKRFRVPERDFFQSCVNLRKGVE